MAISSQLFASPWQRVSFHREMVWWGLIDRRYLKTENSYFSYHIFFCISYWIVSQLKTRKTDIEMPFYIHSKLTHFSILSLYVKPYNQKQWHNWKSFKKDVINYGCISDLIKCHACLFEKTMLLILTGLTIPGTQFRLYFWISLYSNKANIKPNKNVIESKYLRTCFFFDGCFQDLFTRTHHSKINHSANQKNNIVYRRHSWQSSNVSIIDLKNTLASYGYKR